MATPFLPRLLPNFKPGDLGFSSSESGKSLESPSSTPARLGIPRTGALVAPERIDRGIPVDRRTGSSSSLESTNRLRKVGRSSSSSLESAKRLVRCWVAFCFEGFEAPDRPKPGIRIGLLLRREGVASVERRIELRICVWDRATGGAPLLKDRRNVEPGGDKERRLNLLDRIGDCWRPPISCSPELRIDRRKFGPSLDGLVRLKLLSESPELFRRMTGAGGTMSLFAAAGAAAALASDRFLMCFFTSVGSALISTGGYDIGRCFFCNDPLGSTACVGPRNEPRIESPPLIDFRI
jgi:hypothetical protein